MAAVGMLPVAAMEPFCPSLNPPDRALFAAARGELRGAASVGEVVFPPFEQFWGDMNIELASHGEGALPPVLRVENRSGFEPPVVAVNEMWFRGFVTAWDRRYPRTCTLRFVQGDPAHRVDFPASDGFWEQVLQWERSRTNLQRFPETHPHALALESWTRSTPGEDPTTPMPLRRTSSPLSFGRTSSQSPRRKNLQRVILSREQWEAFCYTWLRSLNLPGRLQSLSNPRDSVGVDPFAVPLLPKSPYDAPPPPPAGVEPLAVDLPVALSPKQGRDSGDADTTAATTPATATAMPSLACSPVSVSMPTPDASATGASTGTARPPASREMPHIPLPAAARPVTDIPVLRHTPPPYAGIRLAGTGAPAAPPADHGCTGCAGLAENVAALEQSLQHAQRRLKDGPTSAAAVGGSSSPHGGAAGASPVAAGGGVSSGEAQCWVRVRARRHIRLRGAADVVVVRKKTKGFMVGSLPDGTKKVVFDAREDGEDTPVLVAREWIEPCGQSTPPIPPLQQLFNEWAVRSSAGGLLLPKKHFTSLMAETGVATPAQTTQVFRVVRDDDTRAVDYEGFRDRALPLLAKMTGVPNITMRLLGVPQYTAYTTAYPRGGTSRH